MILTKYSSIVKIKNILEILWKKLESFMDLRIKT